MKMVSHEDNFSVTTAVTSLSILNLISTPALQILLAIPMGAQAVGSFTRIQSYLQLPESPSSARTLTDSPCEADSGGTGANTRGHARSLCIPLLQMPREPNLNWDTKPSHPNLGFTPRSLIAITGPIGCGKSTVLRNLLFMNQAQEPSEFLSKDIAYCPQTPWIYKGTIRDNITGQSLLNLPWYQSVIRSCELDVDIAQIPEGDRATVGSSGSKLSGGQRQRIVSYDFQEPWAYI